MGRKIFEAVKHGRRTRSVIRDKGYIAFQMGSGTDELMAALFLDDEVKALVTALVREYAIPVAEVFGGKAPGPNDDGGTVVYSNHESKFEVPVVVTVIGGVIYRIWCGGREPRAIRLSDKQAFALADAIMDQRPPVKPAPLPPVGDHSPPPSMFATMERQRIAEGAPITYDMTVAAFRGKPDFLSTESRTAFFECWAALQYAYADAFLRWGAPS